MRAMVRPYFISKNKQSDLGSAADRLLKTQSSSHANKANGAITAVSFANAASENQMAIFARRSPMYAASPQKVRPAAATSRCASELCAKNTGYNATQTVLATATGRFTRFASRYTPSSANAETSSMAVRVTAGVNTETFHHAARYAMTSGGCALDAVECGTRLPISRSRAAGMK